MSSKAKSAQEKRASRVRRSDRTKQFDKDWDRLSASGRYDLHRLKAAMLLLVANDGPLPPEYQDHALSGEWRDFRECHVGGDFLLIYQLTGAEASEQVVFVRTGTHAALFRY